MLLGLWPEDIELVHRLWLELSTRGPGSKLHHRDVVGVALRRMAAELESTAADNVIADINHEVSLSHKHPKTPDEKALLS